MRFIPTRVHGYLDYLMAVLLIVSPWLFDFDEREAAKWVAIAIGVVTAVYSLLTNYELGMARLIPMPAHLGLDLLGGVILLVSPWVFGFADEIWWPHVILGVIEIGAALLTRTRPSYAQGLPPEAARDIARGRGRETA